MNIIPHWRIVTEDVKIMNVNVTWGDCQIDFAVTYGKVKMLNLKVPFFQKSNFLAFKNIPSVQTNPPNTWVKSNLISCMFANENIIVYWKMMFFMWSRSFWRGKWLNDKRLIPSVWALLLLEYTFFFIYRVSYTNTIDMNVILSVWDGTVIDRNDFMMTSYRVI